MDRSNELAQALSKALKYTKTLKVPSNLFSSTLACSHYSKAPKPSSRMTQTMITLYQLSTSRNCLVPPHVIAVHADKSAIKKVLAQLFS